jgi:hypothetical protein
VIGRHSFKASVGAATLTVGLLAAETALGQATPRMDIAPFNPEPPPTDVSPQHFAVEFRGGPYAPKIDEGTTAPVFGQFFGDGTRVALGVEVDWQALRIPHFGTLGVGVGWSYTSFSAPNVVVDTVPPTDTSPPPSDEQIFQESSLSIMPMYGVGVLRIDVLAREYHVPLVPYGKFGLATALWWVNNGLGTATNEQGIKGRDISTGIQAALGGMFLLDVLEPTAARTLDGDGEINNSYLFLEWSVSNYPGNQMNVGVNTWVTGLAFEL